MLVLNFSYSYHLYIGVKKKVVIPIHKTNIQKNFGFTHIERMDDFNSCDWRSSFHFSRFALNLNEKMLKEM